MVQVEHTGNIILVESCISNGNNLKIVVLADSNTDQYLKIGKPVELLFNESEVIVGKDTAGWLSVTNKMDCVLKQVVYGKVFSRMQFVINGQPFYALVPTESFNSIEIAEGKTYQVMIKVNDIFLKQGKEQSHD